MDAALPVLVLSGKKLFTILSTRWQDKVTKAALIPSCQVGKQGQEQLSIINRPVTRR